MRRAGSLASIAIALLALSVVVRAQPTPRSEPMRRLLVTVVTRSDAGRVFCALWAGEEGYPTQRRLAVGEAVDRTIAGRRAHCAFADLRPRSEYAVAVFHDENGNNDLDRNVFGIPSEGTGASNDARGFMGPPPYRDARFVFPNVTEHRLSVRIAY